MTATRWPSDSASTWSWVTKIIVVPRRRCRAAISSRVRRRSSASRFESGSSNRNTPGSRTMARPRATRWRCPPDNWPGFRSSSSASPSAAAVSATRRSSSRARCPPHAQAEAQIAGHGHVRVERVALEHHGHVARARLDLVHPPSADPNLSRGGCFEPGDKAQQGALSASRGTHQHHQFAGLHLEVQRPHRNDVAVPLLHAAQHDALSGSPRTDSPRTHGIHGTRRGSPRGPSNRSPSTEMLARAASTSTPSVRPRATTGPSDTRAGPSGSGRTSTPDAST